MNPQETANREAAQQFVELYQFYRQQDQINFYTKRVREFTSAQRQAIWISICLVFITALAGAFAGLATSWLKLTLLLIAAICPILSTTLAGYTALHGFTQQAKLYADARRNLIHIQAPDGDLDLAEHDPGDTISKYVGKVEDVLQKEHGFWGQLAEGMAPPGV